MVFHSNNIFRLRIVLLGKYELQNDNDSQANTKEIIGADQDNTVSIGKDSRRVLGTGPSEAITTLRFSYRCADS